MRFTILAIVLALMTSGCANPGHKAENTVVDTATLTSAALPQQIMALSKTVLSALQAKDYQKFTAYFHPQSGVRFSPYAYIAPGEDQRLPPADFMTQLKSNQVRTWGSYDGSGDPISLSVAAYLEKFVYDADFLQAEKHTVDTFIGSGNSLNNLRDIYPNAIFTEHYFSGFDKKYEGMDWRTLRLVWELYEGKYYLVGIVHDQWTI